MIRLFFFSLCFHHVLSQYVTAPPTPQHPCIVVDIEAQPAPIWKSFADKATCAPGFYCPNLNVSDSSTYASVCIASVDCQQSRMRSKYCEAQGLYEPTLCLAGYYCPNPFQQLQCPAGYFCPLGTHQPIECPPMSICPAGSVKRIYLGALVYVAMFDLALFVCIYTVGRWRKTSDEERTNVYKKEVVIERVRERKPGQKPLSAETKLLCDGFDRARNDYISSLYFSSNDNTQHHTNSYLNFDFEDLSVTIPSSTSSSSTTTSVDDETVKKDNGKKILSGVTGNVHAGKMTAVLGPSGAGKSTFLKMLLGKIDESWSIGGSLLVNNKKATVADFKEIVGYVPQEDIMHNELTVYQNIKMACSIRAPRNWSSTDIESHVESVIRALDLQHVHQVQVGGEGLPGVSGGQKKRVNIGMELAAAPLAIFLDEPTSGLDSTSALQVCRLLKDLCETTGITVAMVIHQPRVEIWNSLDELLLLAPGGKTVYQGPQHVCEQYFTTHLHATIKLNDNPSDALMDAISDRAEEFVLAWKNGGQIVVERMIEEKKKREGQKYKEVQEEKEEEDRSRGEVTFHLKDENEMDTRAAVTSPTLQHHNHSSPSTSINILPPSSFSPPLSSSSASTHLRGASFFTQLSLFFVRSLLQQYMKRSSLITELIIAAIAGAIMGVTSSAPYQGVLIAPYSLFSAAPFEAIVPQTAMYNAMSISLTAASSGVMVFGTEQLVYFREASSGYNRHAYFWGVTFAYFPRIVFLCDFQLQPLAATVASVVLSVFNGFPPVPLPLKLISPMYWASDFYFGKQSERFEHVMQVENISLKIWNYHYHWYTADLLIVIAIGFAYRIIANILIVKRYKNKQI